MNVYLEQTLENRKKILSYVKKSSKNMDLSNPHSLRRLSFVKARADGRLILPDELYRIYDEHMAADETAKNDEAQARLKLYQQLHSSAQLEIEKLAQSELE